MIELEDVYSTCYEDPNYRMGIIRKEKCMDDVKRMRRGSTYLDVGCGRGEMVEYAKAHGVVARGTEIVPDLCGEGVLRTDVCTLPLSDGEFDYVSCYDVLEHLTEPRVLKALDELFRVAKNEFFITTNARSSIHHGVELHLTRKPQEWWHEQMQARLPEGGRLQFSTFGAWGKEWHWRAVLN